MEKLTLFEMDMPFREALTIEGFAFGPENAPESAAVVGSMRGNEVQQAFIAATLVKRLKQLEEEGMLTNKLRITVIPVVNSVSMNIAERFWPMDNTDVNRMFPGYDLGETTQRIADGLFRNIKDCTYGMQLCSFYLPGEFEPHVRVTDTGYEKIDLNKAREYSRAFGFPLSVLKDPSPFDTTTLNYNWQVWDTYAFSLYSAATSTIEWKSGRFTVDCILRFLQSVGGIKAEAGIPDSPVQTHMLRESSLVNVRTDHAGFFERHVEIGQQVKAGQPLADVLSTEDCSVLQTLVSPCDGTVFFRHGPALVNSHTIAFKVAEGQ